MNRQELFEAIGTDLSKMSTEELFRQSGRTGRMIDDAVETAQKGHAVVIVMKDTMHVDLVKERVKDVTGITVTHYNPNSANYPAPFSWATLQGIGKFKEHKVFIDHDVIYFNNRHLFEAATKYDPKFKITGDTMEFAPAWPYN